MSNNGINNYNNFNKLFAAKSKMHALATKKILKTLFATLMIFGSIMVLTGGAAAEPDTIPAWPSNIPWLNYTIAGEPVTDYEDKPYENDPTHGIANVQPKAVDIASGVDASGGGAENNPGDYTSVQWYYYDQNSDSNGMTGIYDDWLFLRMRVAEDPTHGGKYYYKSYHWDILVDTDGDIWKEFVIDINGGNGEYQFGTVGVYYNDNETYEYEPSTDQIWTAEASKLVNHYTRAVAIDYGPGYTGTTQYWIEYRIPVTEFQDKNSTQLLGENTGFRLFFSTSASMTNPLQKDWMARYVFATPPNITVEKSVAEKYVDPGDIIHYTIYFNNTGESNAGVSWINDTLPNNTKYLNSNIPYASLSGNIYSWKFDTIPPGNHTLFLNVTVDKYIVSGTELVNYVHLDYTDEAGAPFPSSEDSVKTIVTAPEFTLEKSVAEIEAYPGDSLHYKIYVTNTAAGCAKEVWVTDVIPTGTTFKEASPNYTSINGNTVYWYFTSFCPGTQIIYLNVTSATNLADGLILNNSVELLFNDANGNLYPKQSAWAETKIIKPHMSIEKTAGQSTATPGDIIEYTIKFVNDGLGTASHVWINDTIPQYTTFVSASTSYTVLAGNTYSWYFTNVAPGTYNITLKLKVDIGTPDETVLVNTMIMKYWAGYDDVPYPDEVDTEEVTVRVPIMTISKIADVTTADPDDIITYTIKYENKGTGVAGDVWINDSIPAHTTFVSSVPAYTSVSGTTYTWHFTDVKTGSNSIIIKVKVDIAVDDGSELLNKVTMDYFDINGNPYTQEGDSVKVIVTAPIFTLDKEADVTTADPGDIITYTITYKNLGTGNAENVWINDTLPVDTTMVSALPTYDYATGNTYTWYFTNVAPGSYVITVNVKVNPFTNDQESMVNKVTLEYSDANGNQPYSMLLDYAYVTCTTPIMSIAKVSDVTTADPGDTITYTITYNNTGTGIAAHVWVNDTISANTTYVSSTPAYTSVSGDTYTWYFKDVKPGTYYITLKVRVDIGTPDGTKLLNSVTLDYTDTNSNQFPQKGDSTTVTATSPIMTISKIADVITADPSDIITYNLTYKNTGTGVAGHVWINDTISADTTYVSSSPTYTSVSGNTYTWHFTDVPTGTYWIILKVQVKMGTEDGTKLVNEVTLDYTDANGGQPYSQQSDTATVIVNAPIMTISKESQVNTSDPGDIVTYEITYKNLGTGTAGKVVIKDTIPADTTYVSSSPSYTSVSGDIYTWQFTNVTPGTYYITVNLRIDVGTADKTVLVNKVTMDYSDLNYNPYKQEMDYANVTVTAPIMSISKVADVSTADPSDVITYTIEYKNTGTGTAGKVWIKDTIPGDTTYVSSTPAYTSVAGDMYTWYYTNVRPGTYKISLKVSVDIGTADKTVLTNKVTLDYTDANSNPYTQQGDSATVTVTSPFMTISKVADVSTADPSDVITYTIEYKNMGTGVAGQVWINDTIPADTTYVSSTPTYTSVLGDTYTWYFKDVATGTYKITLNVTVDIGTADKTVLLNKVSLDYTDQNSNQPYSTQWDFATVTVTSPIMTITKVADVSTADPSDIITYTIEYKNLGTGVAEHVWVNDTIPADTTYVSSTPTYTSVSGDTYTWYFKDVATGTYKITLKVKVDVGTADGTRLINRVTLDYTDANGNPYKQEGDSATVTVTSPIMTITKVADVSTADPDDIITYTIEYKNTGTGTAAHVWVNDTIATDTTYVSSTPTYTSVSGDTFTWHFKDVATGIYKIILRVKVDIGTADGTKLVNKVTLDYTDANGNPYTQESDMATVTVTAPILTITKVADVSTADPSDIITYTIEYKNTGTGTAAHVWVNDTIAADTTYVSAAPLYTSISGDTYTWHFKDLATGTYKITLKVTVDIGTPDKTVLWNYVTLEYTDANSNQPYVKQSDSAKVVVTAPILTVSKIADVTTADPSDIITYTIEYKNIGTGVSAHVWVNDTIPADTTYVTSIPTYTSFSGDTYTWYFKDLKPGTYKITLKVSVDIAIPDGTRLVNKVTLDYTDANSNPYTQESDMATVIVTAPIMTITKVADVTTADPSDIITYTIEYKNIGTGVAGHVWINDTIPADTTYVSSTPNYTSDSGDTFTWYFKDLKPGTYKIILRVSVDIATADGTKLVNTVILDYTDTNTNPYAQESDMATVTVTAPILTITKIADVTTADPSDIITYTIEYKNTGTGVAGHVWINDTIPADTTYVSSTPTYTSVLGDTYTWYFKDVKTGTYTITLKVSVDIATPDGTKLVNKVTLDYTDTNSNPYKQESDMATVTVTAPIMTITKVADVTTADPSDIITYTIEYKNLGTGVCAHVWINDTIPADTTYVSSNPTYTLVSGDIFTWYFKDLKPGTYNIILKVKLDVATADGTKLVNTVTLDYTDTNGNPYTQESDMATVTVTAPIMTITKVADVSTADPNDIITYTIEYKNTGTGVAGHVWINDTIPADTTYVSSNPTYTSVSGDIFTWYFKDLKPGTYKITLKVKVDVATPDGTKLVNKVTLDYTDTNGNPYTQESDMATVTVTAPIMTITKVADVSTADPSDIITYTIEYKNTGTGVAGHVWINDTIPADTTYVSSNPTYTSVSGDIFTWYFKDLKPGTYNITLKVKVDVATADGTKLVNKVTLDYTDTNGDPYTQESDMATVIVTAPIMTITKVADVSTADPSDIITYTIEYKNTGTGVAGHVWINDTIPADTTYVSSNPTYTSVSGDVYTWYFKDVKTGTYTISLKVRVKVGTADKLLLTNKVTLDYTDQNSNQPYAQQSDTAFVTVTAPIMDIGKVADVSTADPDDIITYTIKYENTGTGVAGHVWINDTIPADTTYVSSSPNYTSVSGDTFTWHFTSVKTGVYYITLKVKVDVSTSDKTILINYITLDYTDTNSNLYPQKNDSAKVLVTSPVLHIEKDPDVTTADPGDVITYTIEYFNNGSGNSAIIYINDTIPSSTVYVSSNPAYTSVSGNTYTWIFYNVSNGNYQIILKLRVLTGTADKIKMVNYVTMDYSDANKNFYPQENDTAVVTVTAPIMSISKIADVSTADPGDIITYTITYKNIGTGVAKYVWVNDTIPTETVYYSSTPAYTSVSGNTFTWLFSDVKTGTYTITLKVRVKTGTTDTAVMTNKVSLDYTDATGGQPYAQQSDTATVTVTAPILTLDKVADVSTTDPGDIITYTITYKNIGTGVAKYIWVNDTIPTEAVYVSSTPAYTSISGNTITWLFKDVKTGTYTITLMVRVKTGTLDTAVMTNKVTLDYTDANGGQPYKTQSDSVDVTATSPILTFDKVADVSTADPGDIITYTITYKNIGTGVAKYVWVNDTIPTETVYVSSTPAYTSVSGNTFTWLFKDVKTGTYTITLKVRVKIDTKDTAVMNNKVTMDYTDANGGQPYTTQYDQANVTGTAPIVTLDKVADVSTADPGDIITYTITYKNIGTGVAKYIWVNDTIPTETVYVSSIPAYTSVTGNTITWLFKDVKTGTYTITLKVRVKTGTTDTAVMTNRVSLDYTDANGGQPYRTQYDSADVTATAPFMSISKIADVSTADPGDIITYTITYKNTGTGVAKYVWVNDTIPTETVYYSSTPAYTLVSGNTITWLFKDVKTGTYTITLKVRVKTGTTDTTVMTNKVTLDYTDATGGQPYNTQSDSTDVTTTAPIMTISKIADVSTADPGDIITYTITYKNTGTGAAGYVWINDTIPTQTVYVSSTPAYTSVSGNTYTWLFKDVKTGTYTITLKVRVKTGTTDTAVMTNKVSLDYTDATGGQPYATQYDSTDVTTTAPIMSISKIADVSTADPGDIITYTITYKNTGTGAAGYVWINDTIPSQSVYVSSTPAYTSVSGNTYTWLFKDVKTGTYTITLKVRVKTGTTDTAVMTNKVSLDYTDATGGQPYTTQYDSADVTATAPIMSISKIADVSTADPGDIITYTITYKNTGTGAAGYVWINDTIPSQTVYVSSTPAYTSVSGNTYTWLFKDIKTGTYTITLKVRVMTGTADKTVMTNRVSLDYTDATGGQPYITQYDSTDVTATAPIMSISKVADVRTADPGDIITYTITYKNTGTGAAGFVWINDTIPSQTVYYSSTPAYTTVSGNVYTWLFKDVKTGTYTVILKVRVKTGTADRAIMTNKVSLDYTDATGGQPYKTQYDSTDVTATAPIMSISKVADVSTADPGDIITYTITYKNTGTGAAGFVWINDTIPTQTVYYFSTPMYTSVSGNTYTWLFKNVITGTYTVTLKVRVKTGTADKALMTNRVSLDYTDATGGQPYKTQYDSADVSATAPIMSISKVADVSTADPGDIITYTITYKNTGTGAAGYVWINDTIPTQTVYHSSTTAYTLVSGNTFTWLFKDVKTGTYTITLMVRVKTGTADKAVMTNKVSLDYTDANGGQPYATQYDSADVTATAPVMNIDKTADEVIVNTYIITDFKIRIAGEKWHDVRLTVYDGNKSVALASITRFPGDPDDQSVTIFDVKINPLSGTYYAVIEYTPMDDPINGKIWGANPCWLTLMFEDSSSVRLKHTFNVRHNNTWIWTVDNFEQLLAKAPISYEVVAPYNITYNNTGTGVAGHVWVNDTIPNGSTFVSSSPNFTSVSGDTYTWHFTDVEPGTYYIKITVFKVVGYITEPAVIVLRNNVTLDYTDANGGQPYATQSDYAIVNVTVPILTLIKKEVNPNQGKYGDHLTVTITVNSRIENGTVMDCLPVELNYTGNALDDDSDGLIDEEAKDGIDNDGDGKVDEDLGNFMVDGKPIKSGLNYTGNKLIYSPVPTGQHKIAFDIVIVEKTLIKHVTTNVVQLIHNGKVQEKDTADITLLVWNNAPTAIISSPSNCDTLYEDIPIKFVGDHSYDDGSNLSYSWDFGDGNTSTDVNPTHTYPEPGEYTVSLKITDIYSNSSENKITITILKSTPYAYILKPIKLVFSIGENITFKGNAAYIGNHSTLVYSWDFVDNISAYGKEVIHNFSVAGEYLITLNVTDMDGDYDTALITLTICNTTEDDDDDEEPDDDDEEPDDQDDDDEQPDDDEEPNDDNEAPDDDDDEEPDDDDEEPDDEEPDDDDDDQDDSDDDEDDCEKPGKPEKPVEPEKPEKPMELDKPNINNKYKAKNQPSEPARKPEAPFFGLPNFDDLQPNVPAVENSHSHTGANSAVASSGFVAKNYQMPSNGSSSKKKDEEDPENSSEDDNENNDDDEENNDNDEEEAAGE